MKVVNVAKKTLKVKKMVSDIHAGMDDWDLCEKYDLTNEQLEKVLNKLLTARLITQEELEKRGLYVVRPSGNVEGKN